jgi:hypothetical protein
MPNGWFDQARKIEEQMWQDGWVLAEVDKMRNEPEWEDVINELIGGDYDSAGRIIGRYLEKKANAV